MGTTVIENPSTEGPSSVTPRTTEEDEDREVDQYVNPKKRRNPVSFLSPLCSTQLIRVLILVSVLLILAIITTVTYFSLSKVHKRRPNILLLIADDLGWGDVGWHSSDIKTPNLTRLAKEGSILTQFYSQPICTASRAALFSGRYPFKLGLQGSRPILAGASNSSLPEGNYLLSQLLQDEGYRTHMVGKWHLGFETTNHTPVARGFDTFTGFYNGMQGYFNHRTTKFDSVENVTGYDMRHDYKDKDGRIVVNNILWNKNGTFNNYIFTEEATRIIQEHSESYTDESPLFLTMSYANPHTPIEVPSLYQDMSDSLNAVRRQYSALVLAMDSSIGQITAALNKTGLLDNTLVIFISDNGGSVGTPVAPTGSSNFPLRGEKGGLWEAACRVPAFIWGPGIPRGQLVRQSIHITDLYPTISALAGITPNPTLQQMDGYDFSKTLLGKSDKGREYFIYDLDPVYKQIAIRLDNWKLILGTSSIGQSNSRYQPLIAPDDTLQLGSDNLPFEKYYQLAHDLVDNFTASGDLCRSVECIYGDDMEAQLYDLSTDEYEFRNVAADNADLVRKMVEILNTEIGDMIYPVNLLQPGESAASPNNFNGTWMPWLDNR